MNVVDSSGWLEYLDDGANAQFFEKAILNVEALVVPSISLTEVFKKFLRDRGEESALDAVTQMLQGEVVALDTTISLEAARLGVKHKLPLADSIIFATASLRKATLWTQDEHFSSL